MGVFLGIYNIHKSEIEKCLKKDRLAVYSDSLNIDYDHYKVVKSKNGLFAFVHYVRNDVLYDTDSQSYCATNKEQLSITFLQGHLWKKKKDNRPIEAKYLHRMLKVDQCELIRDQCNGEYSVIHYNEEKDTLVVFNDRLGVEAIYYYHDKNQLIVSNRLRLIREVLQESNPDLETLNWIVAVGIIIGEGTAEKKVLRLPQAAYLTVEKGNIKTYKNDVFMIDKSFNQKLTKNLKYFSFFSSLFFDPERKTNIMLDKGIKECAVNIKTCLEYVPETSIPLSGGKDSRAVLALAHYFGVRKSLNVFTNGFKEHADVIVAKQISDYFQLNITVNTPKASSEVEDEWVFNRMMGHAFQGDGMLGAWDAKGYVTPSGGMGLTGHVGEIYRSNYNKYEKIDCTNIESVSKMFQSINLFDCASLLRPSARHHYEAKLLERSHFYLDNGAILEDIPDLIYTMERVPNWVASLRRTDGYSTRLINPLNTERLIKLAYFMGAKQRRIERIHFEIINRIEPWLASHPLADDHWHQELETYANGTNLMNERIKTPLNLPKFGSWQYKIKDSKQLRNRFLDIFTSFPQSEMWDYCNKKTVEEKFKKADFNSVFELISVYGFINAFFYAHNIELPMKIQTIAQK